MTMHEETEVRKTVLVVETPIKNKGITVFITPTTITAKNIVLLTKGYVYITYFQNSGQVPTTLSLAKSFKD